MHESNSSPDVVLVGAGIMSATLGVMLKELDPRLTIELYEGLDAIAAESSDAWNNAGTGHAALCELNYTPQQPDGSVEISKALQINESFEVTKQLWAYLIRKGHLKSAPAFLSQTPHLSFVRGEPDAAYLRKRFETLSRHHLFTGLEYSEEPEQLTAWMPLVMEGRNRSERVAANRMVIGTDVNFGALTRELLAFLGAQPGVNLHLGQKITGLHRDGPWQLRVKNKSSGTTRTVAAKFVFLGAGGGALPLLQKSGIPEGRGFGGFPVSGLWLRCLNESLIEKHNAKVYGKASVGAPPMSVPHLDTRMIDGKKGLLFGPYAGFSTKFLKTGSYLDLPFSIRPDNLLPMVAAGLANLDLTKYLITQVLQSPTDRLKALQDFIPPARLEDWTLETAGQRVQIIKHDAKKIGLLQFGTEVICAGDGSLAALLGASPGASTTVSIMLTLIQNCFRDQVRSTGWQEKLKEMIPSYGQSLIQDAALYQRLRASSGEVLGIREKQAGYRI